MSESVYIIKPEGLPFRKEIHTILRQSFLIPVRGEFFFTDEILDVLYDNVTFNARRGIYRMMEGERGEIGIVRGNNALQRLVIVSGKETNPILCEENTIRRIFGWSNRILLAEGYYFYGNVIHRPKNPQELKRDLAIARQFLKF